MRQVDSEHGDMMSEFDKVSVVYTRSAIHWRIGASRCRWD